MFILAALAFLAAGCSSDEAGQVGAAVVASDVTPPDALVIVVPADVQAPPADVSAETLPDTSDDSAEAWSDLIDVASEMDVAAVREAGVASDAPDIVDLPSASDVPLPPPLYVDLGGGVRVSPVPLEPGGLATIRYDGELASAPEVWLHIGFDGWSEVSGRDQQSQDDGTNNLDFYEQVVMTPTGDGAHEVTVSLPAAARALHGVFFAGSGDARVWDNNDGRDWGRAVRFPYAGPWLTFAPDETPTSAVVVSFVTGYPCVGEVAWGTDATLGQLTVEDVPAREHHVTLVGLEPATNYHYRVACPHEGAEDISIFRTADSDDAISFLVLADMQDDGEHPRWRDTVSAILADHLDVDFLLAAGDLAWNDRPGLWWTFFDHGAPLFSQKVLMPVPGNHDTPSTDTNPDTSSFERWFQLDPSGGSETFYAFTFGAAVFVGLNSEWPDDFEPNAGAQDAFLAATLSAAAQTADWVFVYQHHPPYNAGVRHWDQQGLYRDATRHFDGVVDWHIAGHEHLYQRMKPLRYNAQLVQDYGTAAGRGVGYLLVPPAGAWPEHGLIPRDAEKAYYRDRVVYPPLNPDSDEAPSESGFVRVDLSGTAIAIEAWGHGAALQSLPPHLVDQVSYPKSK